MAGGSESAAPTAWVAVAAPVPLHTPLAYSVPEASVGAAVPGVRVRVPLGKRTAVGVVVEQLSAPPEGVVVRPLLEVLDLEPVLPGDLLQLARFIADYYLAPIGEVVKAMLPGSLPTWGAAGVWLTDQGALATVHDSVERSIVEWLRDNGRSRLAKLRAAVPDPGFASALSRLAAAGRIALSEERRAGSARYQAALELVAGDREAQLQVAGRSAVARAVIEYLAEAARPATTDEIEQSTGASRAVLKRLADKGLVRRFVQIEKLDLARHEIAVPPFRCARGGPAVRPGRGRGRPLFMGSPLGPSRPSCSRESPDPARPRSICDSFPPVGLWVAPRSSWFRRSVSFRRWRANCADGSPATWRSSTRRWQAANAIRNGNGYVAARRASSSALVRRCSRRSPNWD